MRRKALPRCRGAEEQKCRGAGAEVQVQRFSRDAEV